MTPGSSGARQRRRSSARSRPEAGATARPRRRASATPPRRTPRCAVDRAAARRRTGPRVPLVDPFRRAGARPELGEVLPHDRGEGPVRSEIRDLGSAPSPDGGAPRRLLPADLRVDPPTADLRADPPPSDLRVDPPPNPTTPNCGDGLRN